MLGTKERRQRVLPKSLVDRQRGVTSETILRYAPASTSSNSKDISTSSTSSSLLLKLDQKGKRIRAPWITDNMTLERHSDGSLLTSTLGDMPMWLAKPGFESYRRYRSIPDFLAGEPYGYSNKVYHAAAQIFEQLAVKKEGSKSLIQYGNPKEQKTQLNFDSPKIKRQAYELAYQALKYQELLEEIILDSGFLFAHAMADDQMATVLVMLYDFQNRKWMARCHVMGEEADSDITCVENALWDHKIRLAASLARCRVKNQSLSIDYILPETVRQQEKCASFLPQSTWVNTGHTSVDNVAKTLIELGYCEVTGKQENMLPLRGKYFHRDCHCEDVLLFPWDQKEELKSLDVVHQGSLVLQDKTSSVMVQAVAALLTEDDEYDILHTDVASGLTTAHLAIILKNMTREHVERRERMYSKAILTSQLFKKDSDTSISEDSSETEIYHQPTLYACGVRDEFHRAQLQDVMATLGVTNVKLISGQFENLQPEGEHRFDRVKLILSTPQCTRSAVSNPIEFMLNEGDRDTYSILRDLSHGKHNEHAEETGRGLLANLKTALKFPSVQACVYGTRSVNRAENEQVVNASVKWQRQTCTGTQPFRICPPTVPLMARDIKNGGKSLSNKFLQLRQSPTMNGCFITVLSREMNTDEMTVKDILRRAALKGLVKPVSIIDNTKKTTATITEGSESDSQSDDKRPKLKKKSSIISKTNLTTKKSGKVSSGTSVSKTNSKPTVKTAEIKNPDANDVNRLLGLYNSRKSQEKVQTGQEEVAQVNLNLEFKGSMRLSQTDNKKSSQENKQ